jgi:hypothetical protein
MNESDSSATWNQVSEMGVELPAEMPQKQPPTGSFPNPAMRPDLRMYQERNLKKTQPTTCSVKLR